MATRAQARKRSSAKGRIYGVSPSTSTVELARTDGGVHLHGPPGEHSSDQDHAMKSNSDITKTSEYAKFKSLLGKVLSNPPQKKSPKPVKA
jgi:hypothetical protein